MPVFIVNERQEVSIDIIGIKTSEKIISNRIDSLIERYKNYISFYSEHEDFRFRFNFALQMVKLAKKNGCTCVSIKSELYYCYSDSTYALAKECKVPIKYGSKTIVSGEVVKFIFPGKTNKTKFLDELDKLKAKYSI